MLTLTLALTLTLTLSKAERDKSKLLEEQLDLREQKLRLNQEMQATKQT